MLERLVKNFYCLIFTTYVSSKDLLILIVKTTGYSLAQHLSLFESLANKFFTVIPQTSTILSPTPILYFLKILSGLNLFIRKAITSPLSNERTGTIEPEGNVLLLLLMNSKPFLKQEISFLFSIAHTPHE